MNVDPHGQTAPSDGQQSAEREVECTPDQISIGR